jgi:uncharacterized protein (DUF58 family)
MNPELFSTIRRIQITTTHMVNDVMAGAYHSAFKGQGMEFEDVRGYQPGDDVRSIDWNITARFNAPYVKNFREERELTVMLVVDMSGSCRFGTAERMKSEIIAEIGAVLAFSAIQNNDQVGLLLFTDEVESYIPPKKGVRHVLRVIRDLLAFQPKGKGTNINQALRSLGRLQKKRGICFVISDFMAEDYKTATALTAKRHDLIAIDVSDPAERAFPNMGLITLRDLETGEKRIVDSSRKDLREAYQSYSDERRQERKGLFHKVGAGYLHVPDGDYASRLQRFFKKRELRH